MGGKTAQSKFYHQKSNANYCAVFLGEQGLEILYGDEDAREAVRTSLKDVGSSFTEEQFQNYRLSLVSKTRGSTFETRMMVQQAIIKEVMKQMGKIGWKLVLFSNIQEGTLYGHTWFYEKGDPSEIFENSISISPAQKSEIYISGTSKEFAEFVEETVRSISSEKGIKELVKMEDYFGMKMSLRHKPWDLDEYDWVGGSFLLCHIFYKLSQFQVPVVLQENAGLPSKDPNPRFCFISPLSKNAIKLRRTHRKIIKDLIDEFESEWKEGVEFAKPEDRGFRIQLEGSPWSSSRSPWLVLGIFKVMQDHGHRYWSSFRVDSEGNSRTALAFVTDEIEVKSCFCAIHTRNHNSLSFAGIDDTETIHLVQKAVEENWYKGIKSTKDDTIVCNGLPWNEEMYGELLVCGVFEAMRTHGWQVTAAVNVGFGGDMFIFEQKIEAENTDKEQNYSEEEPTYEE